MKRRETRQRHLVLEAVYSREDHPSADEIYLQVRTRDSKISRGTVYRNLNCLADDGEIIRVKVPGADRYDRRRDCHYHLICKGCGAVRDVSLPYRAELDKLAAEESGYAIRRHRTVFEGLCPNCQKQRNAEKDE